jgi:hypothetical protein
MKHSHPNKRPHGQRGAITIWFALILLVLMGFAALAVDLARMNLVKVELQNAADASALAGAASLIDPEGTAEDYLWSDAETKAQDFAKDNYANGELIAANQVQTASGYWNLNDSTFREHSSGGAPIEGEVPAVQAIVNVAQLNFFFAPLLGVAPKDIQATAVAIVSPPEGGTGLFPFAIGQDVYNNFWDSNTGKPKDINHDGKPDVIQVNLEAFYPSGGAGTWSSLKEFPNGSNNVPDVGSILTSGYSKNPIRIGDDIWISTGDMQVLYKNKQYPFPLNHDFAIPVIPAFDKQTPGSWKPVVAIAGFRITGTGGNGNKSYLTGTLIDATSIPGLTPGINGTNYGAYTPPVLVK